MYRFTIRDVLWLTTLAALAAGWLVDHQIAIARAEDLEDAIHAVANDWAQEVGHPVKYRLPDGYTGNAGTPVH